MVKTAVFIVTSVCLFCFVPFCYGQNTKKKTVRYEIMLKSVSDCKDPQPPFPKKRSIYQFTEIIRTKHTTVIRGNITITETVPFRNYNGRTFLLDSAGHRELKFQILKVSCRSYFGSVILKYGNISYTKNNCSLAKGVYSYILDLKKIPNLLPTWYDERQYLHQTQLIVNNATMMCQETIAKNIPV